MQKITLKKLSWAVEVLNERKHEGYTNWRIVDDHQIFDTFVESFRVGGGPKLSPLVAVAIAEYLANVRKVGKAAVLRRL